MSPEPRAVLQVPCPQCRQPNRPGAFFCVGCGIPLVPAAQVGSSLRTEHNRQHMRQPSKAELCDPAKDARRANWTAFGLSNVGRTRANNEDSVLVSPVPGGGWLLIVADGMGGAEAGEVASATAAMLTRELVESQLKDDPQPASDHRPLMAGAIQAANLLVYRQAREVPRLHGMGSTLTVALVQGSCLELAHVGDSRAYRLTAERRLQHLTLDHSIVEHLIRLGQITPEEARAHPLRNQLYRAIGTALTIEVDTYLYALQPADRLLLCSDGLTLHCADDEIAGLLGAARTPEAAAKALISRALDYGAEDNVTVAVLMAG